MLTRSLPSSEVLHVARPIQSLSALDVAGARIHDATERFRRRVERLEAGRLTSWRSIELLHSKSGAR